jgi:hypothetical protein
MNHNDVVDAEFARDQNPKFLLLVIQEVTDMSYRRARNCQPRIGQKKSDSFTNVMNVMKKAWMEGNRKMGLRGAKRD